MVGKLVISYKPFFTCTSLDEQKHKEKITFMWFRLVHYQAIHVVTHIRKMKYHNSNGTTNSHFIQKLAFIVNKSHLRKGSGKLCENLIFWSQIRAQRIYQMFTQRGDEITTKHKRTTWQIMYFSHHSNPVITIIIHLAVTYLKIHLSRSLSRSFSWLFQRSYKITSCIATHSCHKKGRREGGKG